MRIAFTGANYCGQYFPVPPPHEAIWLPFAPTVSAMFAAAGKTPDWADVFVAVLPETAPVPVDLESCPCPTVAICVDWQQWADVLLAHAPAFDVCLLDQTAVNAIEAIHPGKARPFCALWNFSQVAPPEPVALIADRPHDVVFIGNTVPSEQFRGRNTGLSWLYRLSERFDVRILTKLSREDYVRALCDSKIVFNHASWLVQEAVNARYFEAGACASLVLGENYNAGAREFFSDNEVLFYDEETLETRIEWVIANPDEAQAMADRLHAKTTAPVMPRLLEQLARIVETSERRRSSRSVQDIVVGLVCGFGNWGESARRHPHALQTFLEIANRVLAERPSDVSLLNAIAVGTAETMDELRRFGNADQAEALRRHTKLSPELIWRQALRLDPTYAVPAYNLSRFYAKSGQLARADDCLSQAADRLSRYGKDAVRYSSPYYPVWTARVTCLDRTLTFYDNETPFTRDEDARLEQRAGLLRWRVEELLGDLARRNGNQQQAARHYTAASDACPHIATEALRKAIAIAQEAGDSVVEGDLLRHLIRINPLDIPYRARLAELTHMPQELTALETELSLLRRAIPNPGGFSRSTPEEL